MAKATVLLVLSVCLPLQLAVAFPQQSPFKPIVEELDTNSKELQRSKDSNSSGIDLRTTLNPVINSIFAIIQDHSNTLIIEEGKFFENFLDELNALPVKSLHIQDLSLGLSGILERKKKLDLNDLSTSALNEKAALINDFANNFGDIASVAISDNPSNETAKLQKIIYKLDLLGLNERVNSALKDAVQKFAVIFENLWNSMSAAQREEYKALKKWYESLQSKSVQAKYSALPEFIRSLEGILIKQILI